MNASLPPGCDRKRRDQKPRVLLSCTLCREKKLKCNRELPCANCIKRGQDEVCRYINERRETSQMHSRLQYLERRLCHLEKTVARDDHPPSTPEEIDLTASRTDRASPAAGFLLPERNGSRFINPSHWQAIMNNATRELKKDDGNASGEQEPDEAESSPEGLVMLLAISQRMDVAELLAAVPPRQTADSLVYRCLDSREPSLISTHIPTFKKEYHAFWEHPTAVSLAWLALLYGILSCAVYIEHSMNPAVSEQPLPAVFHTYRTNCAIALAKSNFTIPGRYKVEAAIMYLGVEYLQSNNMKTGISMLLGVVSRLAIMMGYHRDPQPHYSQISTFESEMRRRAWLLLLVIDSIVSRQAGLPRVIHRGLGDVTRPGNLLDEDFGPDTSVLPPSRPEDQIESNITYLLAMEQMLFVAGEIADTASAFTLSPERTLELNQQLEMVHNQIPPIFCMNACEEPTSSTDTLLGRYAFEIIYQHTRCILYRQYLVPSRAENQHPDFRRACVDAARQILARQSELFQGVLGKPRNRDRVWFGVSRSVSDCMTAAMVVCLEVINQSRSEQSPNSTVRAELTELLKASHLSWKLSPRPSLETRKAADIVATMLRLLGADGCENLASGRGDEDGQHVPAEGMVDETYSTSPSSPIHDMLNGDAALEIFDWALWDREMQQLNGIT